MLVPRWNDPIEKDHQKLNRQIQREKYLWSFLESCLPFGLGFDLRYSFGSISDTLIRVFFYISKVDSEKMSEEDLEKSKHQVLDFMEAVADAMSPTKSPHKSERFFRDNEGTFAYRCDINVCSMPDENNKDGEYTTILFLEEAFEPECKITKKKKMKVVYEAECKATGEKIS